MKTSYFAVILVLFALGCGKSEQPKQPKYHYDHIGQLPIRTDNETGKGEIFLPRKGWVEKIEDEKPVPQSQPVVYRLTDESRVKIDINGTLNEYIDGEYFVKGNLYNGTDWTITKIVIRLSSKESATPKWSQDYYVPFGSVPPNVACSYRFTASPVNAKDAHATLVDAFGYKPSH